MLFPETEIDMYWTSLGVSDEEVIALYHNHAVCEQYHSEIKTDMGIERLPSSKFDTNALILKLTMIAYNILRIIGTAAMKGHDMPVRHSTIKRRRIRTVIDNLILIAGHLTDHARKLRLALEHCNGWICTFFRLAESLRCFYTPTHTVNLFDLRCRKFFLRQICHNNFSRIFHFETNDPYGKLVKLCRSFAVIIFWKVI